MTETTHLPFGGFVQGDDSNSYVKRLRSELTGLETLLYQLARERFTLEARRDELLARLEGLEQKS